MPKQLLVYGAKTFKISVPDGAAVTFGPWSPPSGTEKYGASEKALNGTLRIYQGSKATENIIAVFSGVRGFRDLSLDYEEEVAREEGAVIWKSDKDGYKREEKVSHASDWVIPSTENLLPSDDDEQT